MPAEAVTPPAAPPATPPALPATPPPIDPFAPPQYVPMSPENDPDHQLKQMISRRRKPAASAPVAAPDAPPVPPPPPPPGAPPAAPPDEPDPKPKPPAAGFNDALAGVFGWKPTPKKTAEPKAEEPVAPATEIPAAPAEPAAPPKTIVGKKKAAPAPPAAPDITQITTAATTAAVRALRGEPKPEAPAAKPEANLAPEDRHDYEVAVKLAEINPKYKDAPRIILDHVKKSDAYAARWETANPGKQYDPNDDEHNEFVDSLEKPWSDFEFRKAERKLDTDEESEHIHREVSGKIKALEQDNARLELTPIVNQTFINAAGHMARQLEVFDKLKDGDFAKFQEEDPITAEAMGAALGPIQPLIEAIVQIDDPKGRFPVDEKIHAHQQWLQLLADKETQFQGVESTDGKMFATRTAFHRMNDAQRARHWYLTPDHLVTEVVQDAIATAVEKVKTEKERQKKIALSLGYVLQNDPKPAAAKTAATNGAVPGDHAAALPGVQKPVSPSVGSGAKIDTKGGTTPTGRAATLSAMGDILFRAGNPVP